MKRLPVVTADVQALGIVSGADLLGAYDRPDADITGEILKQVIGEAFALAPLDGSVALRNRLHCPRHPRGLR